MRVKDPQLSEQVSKFLTEQGAEFFAIESRRELAGLDQGNFDIALDYPIACMGLSAISREKARIHQFLVVADYDRATQTSNLHIYDSDGCPQPTGARHKPKLPFSPVVAVHFTPDSTFFMTTSFRETGKPTKEEMTYARFSFFFRFPLSWLGSHPFVLGCCAGPADLPGLLASWRPTFSIPKHWRNTVPWWEASFPLTSIRATRPRTTSTAVTHFLLPFSFLSFFFFSTKLVVFFLRFNQKEDREHSAAGQGGVLQDRGHLEHLGETERAHPDS